MRKEEKKSNLSSHNLKANTGLQQQQPAVAAAAVLQEEKP